MNNAKGFGQPVNNSNGNGKQATVQPQPQHQTSQEFRGSRHQATLNQLASEAQSAAAGAKQAELQYVAGAIERQKQAFEADTDAISETLATLLDPRAKLCAAYLKATDKVKEMPDFLPVAAGGYSDLNLALPGVPSFSSYYSQPSQSAPQLAASPNGNEQNAQNNEPIDSPHS
ncbi:MAG TPA: hypothetical protein V6C65_06835 [Allocoleopsis sp.]